MADKLFPAVEGVQKRMKDMGDGTHAEVVFLSGASGGSGTAIGSPTDPAWNGTDPSASLISIMKAVHARLVEIENNTGV